MPREKAGVDLRREWVAAEVEFACPGGYETLVPEKVYVPMLQHTGVPCAPLVKKGDRVRLGQKIGDSDQFISAPVHASVSGRVLDIAEYPQARGGGALCVVIQNDGREERVQGDAAASETPEEIRRAVREAGLAGMGGAAFPTHVKLDVRDAVVDTLVLNGAECEPGIFADNALMHMCAHEIVTGAHLAMRAVGANRILIGIEGDKAGAVEMMTLAAETAPASVKVGVLPWLYPQGAEKQLIQTLTGRQVPEGALPPKAGAVVLNVATARAVFDAVERGTPLTHRICTVTGDVKKPQNVRFPLGTRVGEMLEFCGGFSDKPSKLLVGGPMMGVAADDFSVPLVKSSNGLVVVGERHDALYTESACIRCNRCVEVCPMHLMPWSLERCWRVGDVKGCQRFHAQSCINCGCCSYICPAARPLAEKITEAKNMLAEVAQLTRLAQLDREAGNA